MARATRSRERSRLPLEARRAQLVELGLELFRRHGYTSLSIDDIARHAGVSKGLLYHYFPSKRDYYLATVKASAARLLEATLRPGAEGEAVERLRRGLAAYVDTVADHREAYLSLMQSAIGADREVLDVIEGVRTTLADRLLGDLDGDDPAKLRVAVRGVVGLVEAAVMQWLRDGAQGARNALVEFLMQCITGTLLAAGARPRVAG